MKRYVYLIIYKMYRVGYDDMVHSSNVCMTELSRTVPVTTVTQVAALTEVVADLHRPDPEGWDIQADITGFSLLREEETE